MTSSITFLVVALALALGLYQIFRALRLFKKPDLLKNHAAGVYELPEEERNRVFGGRDPEEVVSIEVLKTVLKTGKVPVLKETPVMALPTITRSRLQISVGAQHSFFSTSTFCSIPRRSTSIRSSFTPCRSPLF